MNKSEIRIVNPDKKLMEVLKASAKDERRGLGKQAEEMIDWALSLKGYYKKYESEISRDKRKSK